MYFAERIALVGGILFLAALLMVFDDFFKPIQLGAHDLTTPVVANSRKASSSIADIFARVSAAISGTDSRKDLELAVLRSENATLRLRLSNLQREVRTSGSLQLVPQVVPLPCRMTWYDPSGAPGLFVIDRGTRDGLVEGMYVFSGSSCVGRVIEAGSGVSIVVTVRHSMFRIPVAIEPGGAKGIACGTGKCLEIQFVATDSTVTLPAEAFSSDVNDFVPPGMYIGSITSAVADESRRLWRIQCAPSEESKLLESLYVPLNFLETPKMHIPREAR
jgi:cell shape-determining protein MreC